MQLSNAAMEVLAIVAYNNRITKADIDTIRGTDSSGTIYKLQDYGLIEQAGKADLPGKPMTYKVTGEFLKMFNIRSLKELPELPRFKLDSNRQILIDDIENESENSNREAADESINSNNNIENESENSNSDIEKKIGNSDNDDRKKG